MRKIEPSKNSGLPFTTDFIDTDQSSIQAVPEVKVDRKPRVWAYSGLMPCTAVSRKVVMGNGSFYGCLSELQSVSAWWKETAQTHVFLLCPSLLLNHLEPQTSKAKLLLPIMPIGFVACSFTLSWDNLCRNGCMPHAGSN